MNDLEFVRRCIENDAGAWDEFLQKYSKLIYNYIHSVLKIKGKDISQCSLEDLFQEIIFSLIKDNHKKLKVFKARNGCSLASWLRIITINFTIDYIRKIRPTISLEEDLGDGKDFRDILRNDSHLELKEAVAQEEQRKELAECVEELSIDDKYFLKLYIEKEMPAEDLRSMLGISRSAVDMRKSRIIQKLKDCFKKKDFLLDF
jgi:RNA polymerase sigma-70 factor (ECF subfamily)